MLSLVIVAILIALAWVLFAIAVPRLLVNPRGDVVTGLAWHLIRLYVRVVHRLRVEGLEHVPRWKPGEPPVGPLVIVANHTAGVDPLLIQAYCAFEVRWLMMSEMMVGGSRLAPLWEWLKVIPVGGTVPGSQSARAAIKCLERGGVVGVFPEGGIERPRGTLMPFEPGIGLIIAKSGASVLPVVIEGTPECEHAYQSLYSPSPGRGSCVRFLPVRAFGEKTAKEIVRELEGVMGAAMANGQGSIGQ